MTTGPARRTVRLWSGDHGTGVRAVTQRMRRTTVVVVACALLATAGVWGAMMLRADAHHGAPSSSTRGPLTEEQYAAAVRVAQHEVDQQKPSRLTSATAVLKPGNVRQPNMADACHSGQVVKIRLVGRFPRIVTGGLAARWPAEWIRTGDAGRHHHRRDERTSVPARCRHRQVGALPGRGRPDARAEPVTAGPRPGTRSSLPPCATSPATYESRWWVTAATGSSRASSPTTPHGTWSRSTASTRCCSPTTAWAAARSRFSSSSGR